MKKVLVLLLGLFFFSANAQKMSSSYLQGQWISDEGTQMTVKIDNRNNLTISKTLQEGNSLKIIRYYMGKENLYMDTVLEQTNYEASSKYYIIDNNTMVADITSAFPGQTIYKRVLNNKTN
jgi:hypothetical protein